MRQALQAQHEGRLVAPPRITTDLAAGRMVFTTGVLDGERFGYRSYDSFDVDPGAQVVVVHDWTTGAVRGVAVGNEMGPRRVGAIGAVAVDLLARSDATNVGIVGTGTQAWAQLWAIRTVRPLAEVTVFSRDPGHRADFAMRAAAEFGLAVHAVDSAEAAVRDHDIAEAFLLAQLLEKA